MAANAFGGKNLAVLGGLVLILVLVAYTFFTGGAETGGKFVSVAESDLVAHYTFEGGSPMNNVAPGSLGSHDGVDREVTFSDGVLVSDGNGYMELENHADINPVEGFTIASWVNFDEVCWKDSLSLLVLQDHLLIAQRGIHTEP
ncbi:MAG: hypothetical protein QGI80_02345 [archaeon]|nr:hypothetical protein [archaeon]